LVGVIAGILAVFILLNPEFLALGILGDTAFFDLLVLLISLQLRTAAAQVWAFILAVCSRIKRSFLPPRFSYMLVLSTFAAIGIAVSAMQKFIHRISS
jgi:hypothetical protein